MDLAVGGVALAPAGDRVYAVRWDWYGRSAPAELVVIEVGPSISTASPRVVGTGGSGQVTVEGTGLAPATVTVGGQPTTILAAMDTMRRVVVPALPAGPADLTVRDPEGQLATAPLVVRDLGPFPDSAAFAERQHQDFLGRGTSLGDRLAVDAALADGGSLGTLPVQLAGSATFSEPRSSVIRLYQAMFLRPPDTAGLELWLGRLRAGRSLTWVASCFAASAELRARDGELSNGAFVDRIYQNVLGREAEPAGRAFWVGVLDAGRPRGKVVLGFSQSGGNRANRAVVVEVTNLHLGLLRRAPSPEELAGSVARAAVSSIAAVGADIVTSAEYRERVG